MGETHVDTNQQASFEATCAEHQPEQETLQAPRAGPAKTISKAALRQRRPRERIDNGRRITSMRPKVHNRDERPAAVAKREANRKRAAEYRQRRKASADRKIGDFEYDGRLLTWLAICIRPLMGRPYLEEEAVELGQSERQTDLRKYDLALRAAVTAFLDDVVQDRVAL